MSMSPRSSADFVSGPPASSALNALKCRPYFEVKPASQNGRVGHSGGPPRVILLAIGAGLELDGPPVDPHEVVTSASATMLAPSTKIRSIRITFHLPKIRVDKDVAESRDHSLRCRHHLSLQWIFLNAKPFRRGEPLRRGKSQ